MFCDCGFTLHCQVGHQSRDCPEPRNERGGRAGGGGFGGQDQEAYSSFGDKRGGGGGGGGGRECYNCGKVGHQVLFVFFTARLPSHHLLHATTTIFCRFIYLRGRRPPHAMPIFMCFNSFTDQELSRYNPSFTCSLIKESTCNSPGA